MNSTSELELELDEAGLQRAARNIEARLPRLRQAADAAREAYIRSSQASGAIDDTGSAGQAARRDERKNGDALRAVWLDKQATVDAEQAALSRSQQQYAAAVAAREAAALAEQIAEEKRACGSAVAAVHTAAVAFSDAMDRLAKLHIALDQAVVDMWQALPAATKTAVAFRTNGGTRTTVVHTMLRDRKILPGLHSQMDATAPDVTMQDFLFGLPELAELLPPPTADDGEMEVAA